MTRYHKHEEPKPIGTIIGVVIALGGILIFFALVGTGVIKLKRDTAPVPPPTGSSNATGPSAVSAPVAPPAAPNEVRVVFNGKFDRATRKDDRRVDLVCPNAACGKPIEAKLPQCPLCSTKVVWPNQRDCEFCGKTGVCNVCKGEGKCSKCKTQPKMLYGMEAPCEACDSTKKCPACGGSGACRFCEKGIYVPGHTPVPQPVKLEKPVEPVVKPDPSPETKPAETPAPAPAPAPEPAPAPAG